MLSVTVGFIVEHYSTEISGNILTLLFNLKPFDLKEIDIMVSFPDNYPQEVKTSASIDPSYFEPKFTIDGYHITVPHTLDTFP